MPSVPLRRLLLFLLALTLLAGGPASAGAVRADIDSTPPDTTITSGPSGTISTSTPNFAFVSSEAGSTFQCHFDTANGGVFRTCTSPFTAPALSEGAHVFEVRSIDPAGNVEPTPAIFRFTVGQADPIPPADDPGYAQRMADWCMKGAIGTYMEPNISLQQREDKVLGKRRLRFLMGDQPPRTVDSAHQNCDPYGYRSVSARPVVWVRGHRKPAGPLVRLIYHSNADPFWFFPFEFDRPISCKLPWSIQTIETASYGPTPETRTLKRKITYYKGVRLSVQYGDKCVVRRVLRRNQRR